MSIVTCDHRLKSRESIVKEINKMKAFTVYLLFGLLFGIILPVSFAQQEQPTQKQDSEIETLKNRITVLQNQLQTVENVEKMELISKLTEANAKLLNAEIDKFKRELKDANDEWLRTWSHWFVGILGFLVLIIGGAFWFWFRSISHQLIADKVEESLDRFREILGQVDVLKNELTEAVNQVNILEDQVRILKKEQAISVLSGLVNLYDPKEQSDYEETSTIQSETLLDVFVDKTRNLGLRYKAGEVLSAREIPQFVSPLLEFLNSVINSEFDWKDSLHAEPRLLDFVNFLGHIHTQEVYEELKKILDRLLSTEDVELKKLLLTQTVFSLARVSGELNTKDSVSLLKKAIPYLNAELDENQALKDLAEYFDRFNEPEGIKEILTNGLTDEIPDVETRCLELLQKHDPEFVEKWQAQKEPANTQNEESE